MGIISMCFAHCTISIRYESFCIVLSHPKQDNSTGIAEPAIVWPDCVYLCVCVCISHRLLPASGTLYEPLYSHNGFYQLQIGIVAVLETIDTILNFNSITVSRALWACVNISLSGFCSAQMDGEVEVEEDRRRRI